MENFVTYIWPCDRRSWRRRWKQELYAMYNDLNFVNFLELRRLSWAGPVILMVEGEIPKRVFKDRIDWMRRRGKPRLI